MSEASVPTQQTSLLKAPVSAAVPQTSMIANVAKEFGISPLRQMREIFALKMGAQKLAGPEYYSLRLFDPQTSVEDKKAILGQTGINALNSAMNPPAVVPTRAFVGNKLLYTQLLAQLGIATAATQAVVSTFREAGTLPMLRDATAVEDFLRKDAVYPLFGKPHHGSLSEGSVRIDAIKGDQLILANGATLDVAGFAQEVLASYPGGFLLQSALSPQARMAEIAGGAIGCVRVVTVNDGSGPKPAYAVWKLPAPDAMSDNFWQAGSLLAMLDVQTGRVLRCQRGTGLQAEMCDVHPTSGQQITGVSLPMWKQTLDIALAAHAVFPEFGICGFDIGVTEAGPHVLECNDNPSHMLYQIASGRGVCNGDLSPIWDAVIERQKKQAARMKASSRKAG